MFIIYNSETQHFRIATSANCDDCDETALKITSDIQSEFRITVIRGADTFEIKLNHTGLKADMDAYFKEYELEDGELLDLSSGSCEFTLAPYQVKETYTTYSGGDLCVFSEYVFAHSG